MWLLCSAGTAGIRVGDMCVSWVAQAVRRIRMRVFYPDKSTRMRVFNPDKGTRMRVIYPDKGTPACACLIRTKPDVDSSA